MIANDEVTKVVMHARAILPEEPSEWPGGWPDEVEAALIDAVLSIRAVYGSPTTGVRAAIQRWRAHRQVQRLDDMTALARVDPATLADVLKNHQVLSGGSTKAEAVTLAAKALHDVGVQSATDLDASNSQHKRAYTSVRGLGPVTWSYLCMLVGQQDSKADVWIRRFVSEALNDDDTTVSAEKARQLMISAAAELEAPATQFDHAVWAAVRRR